jgi:hypothetical protein
LMASDTSARANEIKMSGKTMHMTGRVFTICLEAGNQQLELE